MREQKTGAADELGAVSYTGFDVVDTDAFNNTGVGSSSGGCLCLAAILQQDR